MRNIAYSCTICTLFLWQPNLGSQVAETSNNTVLNLRKFPEDLKRKCKMKALEQGITLTEMVIRCLREAVEPKKPVKQSKGD